MHRLIVCALLLAGCASPALPPDDAEPAPAPTINSQCTANGTPCELANQRHSTDFEASPAQPFTWSFHFHGGTLRLTVSTQVTVYAGLQVTGDASCTSSGVVAVAGSSTMGMSCGTHGAGNMTLTITPTGYAAGTIMVQGARAV